MQYALPNLFLLLTVHKQAHSRTCGRVSPVTSNVGSAHTCRVTHILIMEVQVRHLLRWLPRVCSRCSVCCLPADKKCCTPGLYFPCDVTYSCTPDPYSRGSPPPKKKNQTRIFKTQRYARIDPIPLTLHTQTVAQQVTKAIASHRTDPVPLCASDSVVASHARSLR